MSYTVIPNACEGYGKRKGLEGPFNFSGVVLYYDAREGKYYNPKSDLYMEKDEMDALNEQFYNHFKKVCA